MLGWSSLLIISISRRMRRMSLGSASPIGPVEMSTALAAIICPLRHSPGLASAQAAQMQYMTGRVGACAV